MRKNMRIVSLILILSMVMNLCACSATDGKGSSDANNKNGDTATAAQGAAVDTGDAQEDRVQKTENQDQINMGDCDILSTELYTDLEDEQAQRVVETEEADREREEQLTKEAEDEFGLAAGIYVFTSGMGAWETRFQLEKDGTFTGYYSDEDWGVSGTLDSGESYEGTIHERHFSGRFSIGKKLSDHSYELILEEYSFEGKDGEERLEQQYNDQGQIYYYRVVNSVAIGLEGGWERFILYDPSMEKEEMPFAPWDFYDCEEEEAFAIGFGLEDEMRGAFLRIGEAPEAEESGEEIGDTEAQIAYDYPPYKTIALQVASTGYYITNDVGAKNNKGRFSDLDDPVLNADATKIQWYEEFELVPCKDGSFALRSAVSRKFLTCTIYHKEKDYADSMMEAPEIIGVLKCDSDFVYDGVNKNKTLKLIDGGRSASYKSEAVFVKLSLEPGTEGIIKFKSFKGWLYVEGGKLRVTTEIDKAEVFNQILVDDNHYTDEELRVLSSNEWFDLNNQGMGGLYDIQCDIGNREKFNANTLRNLGYTIMNIDDKFEKHDYILLTNTIKTHLMQCFVAYKKTSNKYDVIIAFQGTGGYGDEILDGTVSLEGGTYTEKGVHAGYQKMAQLLIDNEDSIKNKAGTVSLSGLISAAKDGNAHFTIIGHSMGGAIAQCYALHLANEKNINPAEISGRTFNPALACNFDDDEFTDWYNLCVSTDSVSNGLVLGSIIYYGIHRLGKTIWLYDHKPDDNDPDGLTNISNDKHDMDACLNQILHSFWDENE